LEKGIGIYIGRKEVIAARIGLVKGVPQLREFAIEPIGSDSSTDTQAKSKKQPTSKTLLPEVIAIERAIRKMGLRHTQGVAAFSPFHVVTRHFTIPAIPRREWSSTVPNEARRFIPFRLDETIMDYHAREEKRGKDGSALSIVVSAVKREMLRSYVSHLRQGNVKVDMVEPTFCSIARAVNVVERFEQGKVYGFVFLDSDGSVNITFFSDDSVKLSRDFLLSEDQVSNQNRFYQELKASIDFVGDEAGAERGVMKVFLAGNGDLPFWLNFLTSIFEGQISFEIVSFPSRKDVPREVLGALIVPIGLALRAHNFKSPTGDFSLLPPEERETKRERIKRIVGIEFLIIALLFIGLRLLVLEPYVAHSQKKAREQLSPEAIADPLLSNQPLEELQKTKGLFQERILQLRDPNKSKSSISKILHALASVLPDSMWLDQISYGGKSRGEGLPEELGGRRSLELSGVCYRGNSEQEVQTINEWVSQVLAQNKMLMSQFKTFSLEDVRRERMGYYDTTRFKVVCR